MPLSTAGAASANFDPIEMEVFSNRLLSITEDMALHMMRSSFSSQIKERRDFSVGLFDARGRMVAQGTHVPLHLASLVGSMAAVLEACPPAAMRPGDAFISNDPYLAGGSHLPDIAIVSPVFHGGELVAFAANVGHHADVGGAVAGSTSALARSVFEEGIRLPAVRIATAEGSDENLMRVIAANSRLPEERRLDLAVQIATNERGAAAMRRILDQNGRGRVDRAIDAIIAYTAQRLKRRLEGLEGARGSFTTWLDDDGFGGDMVPVTATVSVARGRLLIDFAGTGPQARGGVNAPLSAVRATAYYCVKALIDPGLLPNSGLFEAVELALPPRSIVSPLHPAAVGARSLTCQKIAGAIFGAFRDILPEDRVMASSNDVLPSILFSGLRSDGRVYVCGETLGGGSGVLCDMDGMDAVHVHCTNTMNLPVEALENEFPLMVVEYALADGSAGAGRRRGGMGVVRTYVALQEDTVLNCRSDSHRVGAAGVRGGGDGGRASLWRNFGKAGAVDLGGRVEGITLTAGDTIRIQTAGGGGYGPEGRG